MSLRASTITSAQSQNSRSTQILCPRSRLRTLRFERLSCIKLQLHVIYTKEAPVSAKVTPQITVENETRSQNIGTGEHFCHLVRSYDESGWQEFLKKWFSSKYFFSDPASSCAEQMSACCASTNTVRFFVNLSKSPQERIIVVLLHRACKIVRIFNLTKKKVATAAAASRNVLLSSYHARAS